MTFPGPRPAAAIQPSHVLVIGAGAAGLYAARLLQRAGRQVTVLEADDRPGGRVRTLAGWAPWPLDLGAEELHGQRSLPYRLARQARLPLRERGDRLRLFPDLIAGRSGPPGDDDPDLLAAERFVHALPGYAGADGPLAAALAPLPPRARLYLDAVLGNEYGASSDRLGLVPLARAEGAWLTQGARNFTVSGGMRRLLPLIAPAGAVVRTGCPVTALSWSGEQVVADTGPGPPLRADAAIVCVPLPVLRDGDIRFTPPLPPDQIAAAGRLGGGPTLKIFLRFRRPLWPRRRTTLTLLGAPHAPELWTCGSDAAGPDDRLLTALLSGRHAERFLDRGAAALPALLADLDVALGRLGRGLGPRPASANLTDHLIHDWSAAPFVRCGYSYPTPGSVDARALLRRPLRRPGEARPRVTFAGEATHDRLFGSLQGALLSAEQAVRELLLG